MNNYHVYEAIGKGKHSTVYKGRKKKTLEYYAVKSVDKLQRSKVLQEVQALHKLQHPNILKFFSCYETSAHLWLVLEYCVGGDLMTLLRQDHHLPEDSIHDLARDIVKALQYLHSKGIIYCDLKPSNILLDENGRMKLCDFGLARHLTDISKSSLSTLPQAKRGTPCYMAPELFQDGGVHSFASDFWALGCVLYECYAGIPPFVGNEFTQLVEHIIYDPVPPLPNNPSTSFVNLIKRLLVKDPSERIQWPELCEHSFWRAKFTPISLPPQPAFDNMLQLYCKPCLSDCNGNQPVQQNTPQKHQERGSSRIHKKDENYTSDAKGYTTPVRQAQSGKRPNAQVFGTVDYKRKETSTAVKGANILRLSRIAKQNLQRQNEKENYRRPLPKPSDDEADINIENNDMELDFSENPEDDSLEESDPSDDASCVHEEKDTNEHQTSERGGDSETNINQHENYSESNTVLPDVVKSNEQELCLENVEAVTTPSSVGSQRKVQRAKMGPGNVLDLGSPSSSGDLSEIFWHPSDLSVKPVMPIKKCDKASEGVPMLPFDAPSANDYVKLKPSQLESLNNQISHTLSGTTSLSEKQNTIKYLEMLSMNSDVANSLTNGPVMLLLVKMLRLSKTTVLRVQLASVIGLLIRHSTFIKPDLMNCGLINALMDGLRDKQDKIRRFSMVALGEMLFYISTQSDQSRDSNVPESSSKDNRTGCGWQVPSSVIALVSSILRKGEDDVTQLYALRSIENICSQGTDWASRFMSQNTIANLCYIYKAMGKQESTRLTAGSCLVRMARFSPTCIASVFDKFSMKEVSSSLSKGSTREQQISLNLLNMAMLGGQNISNFSRQLISLEEKVILPSLISLIEQGSEILRGKALIFIALLCKSGRKWLPYFFCNAKLLSAVDRLAKEKDCFIQQCTEAFVHVVATTVPEIVDAVRGEIQQMLSGKRHGQIAALSARGNPKSTSHLFPVLVHLLGSSSFKQKVVSNHVLAQLANIIKLMESPFQGRDDFQITLLQILESISEDTSLILDSPKIFTGHLLPSLSILYKGNKDADARFLCLKVLFDVMVILLNDTPDTFKEDEIIMEDLKVVSDAYFLPLYPILIEDEDPIPMYAQKLLVMLIEFNHVMVSSILDLRTVSQCFEFLLGDLSTANVNNVKLCLALTSAPEMDAKILSQLRVVRKIGNLLEFVNAKEMDDFLEPTLALCKAFILHNVGGSKGIAYSKQPALLLDTSAYFQIAADQQHYIKDITDFGSNVGVFLDLISSNASQVADLASECVVLFLKAAAREATMGFMTNLPKISCALHSTHSGISGLLLLRLLYSLAFACRQYLSQAMILSISVSDVRRIEATISNFKSSSFDSIAKAASVLSVELQRLPRI